MAFPFLAIPVLIKAGAALMAVAGLGAAAKGAVDSKKAHDTVKEAKSRNESNLGKFQESTEATTAKMNRLGELQADVGRDFSRFVDSFVKIQSDEKDSPSFSTHKLGADIPSFDLEQIKASSVAAGALISAVAGGVAGATFGTAAAAGLTTTVMTLGTASTGTAIASLSGVAATNATLAFLGGGTLAAGGGGIALGAAALSAATLGVGLLIGGAIFSFSGSKSKEKSEEVYSSMLQNEKEIKMCIKEHARICKTATRFYKAIKSVYKLYDIHVCKLFLLVEQNNDWDTYDINQKLIVHNTIRLVSILHKMINTPLLNIIEGTNSNNEQTQQIQLNNAAVDEFILESKNIHHELTSKPKRLVVGE